MEADELSYRLPVVLRWELERRVLEGDLAVAELPAAWNRRMSELLGKEPTSDGQGCLQDVQWSERFSLTDLVATALSTCMLTIMGIVAERHGWSLEGATARVERP